MSNFEILLFQLLGVKDFQTFYLWYSVEKPESPDQIKVNSLCLIDLVASVDFLTTTTTTTTKATTATTKTTTTTTTTTKTTTTTTTFVAYEAGAGKGKRGHRARALTGCIFRNVIRERFFVVLVVGHSISTLRYAEPSSRASPHERIHGQNQFVLSPSAARPRAGAADVRPGAELMASPDFSVQWVGPVVQSLCTTQLHAD